MHVYTPPTSPRRQTHSGRSLPHGLSGWRAAQTFTAEDGDLGKRVVTAVALAPDDPGLAAALAAVHVAGAAVGAVCEAVAGQAGVLPRGPVVILLREPEAEPGCQPAEAPPLDVSRVTAGLQPGRPHSCRPPMASRPMAPGAPCRWHLGLTSQQVLTVGQLLS